MDYSKLAEKNILVTGGCGFIGSNLCDFLVDIGSNVTCLDNLSTGYLENIEHLNKLKNFQFINADIRDYKTKCFSSKVVVRKCYYLCDNGSTNGAYIITLNIK